MGVSAKALHDCYSGIVDSLMKSAFLVSKGLFCLYDKQNKTWLLTDLEFLFLCSARHLTRSLRSLVSYQNEHSKEIPYQRTRMYYSLYMQF